MYLVPSNNLNVQQTAFVTCFHTMQVYYINRVEEQGKILKEGKKKETEERNGEKKKKKKKKNPKEKGTYQDVVTQHNYPAKPIF